MNKAIVIPDCDGLMHVIYDERGSYFTIIWQGDYQDLVAALRCPLDPIFNFMESDTVAKNIKIDIAINDDCSDQISFQR